MEPGRAEKRSRLVQAGARAGDVLEVSRPLPGRPLVDPLAVRKDEGLIQVRPL